MGRALGCRALGKHPMHRAVSALPHQGGPLVTTSAATRGPLAYCYRNPELRDHGHPGSALRAPLSPLTSPITPPAAPCLAQARLPAQPMNQGPR